jgi:hypothetical protein
MQYPKRKRRKKSDRSRLIRSCSILWAKATKLPTGGRCALCGSNARRVESHHIIRKGQSMHHGWFLMDNCIVLCYKCHYDGIHSTHFPTTQIYQEKILAWLKRKGIEYEELYNRCRRGPRMDTEELRRILKGLNDFIRNF